MSPTLAVGLLAAILLFWAVGAHNRLVRLRSAAAQSFTALDEQFLHYVALVQASLAPAGGVLRPALAALLGASTQFEAALKAARQQPLDVMAMRTLEAAHAALLAAWTRMVSEPPDLAGSVLPEKLLLEWQHIDQQAHAARELFLGRVRVYNEAIHLFPARLLAKLLGLGPAYAF